MSNGTLGPPVLSTNVPPPTFSAQGFQSPTTQEILIGVIQDWLSAFGSAGFNLNLDSANSESLTTPQGQLATALAAVVANVYAEFVLFTNLIDPAFTYGRFQDAIGRIYFQPRISGQPTVLQATCIGLPGTIIPNNALITDPGGNLYQATGGATIGTGGSVVVSFECIAPGAGPVQIPPSVSVYQAVQGWDDAELIGGTVGRNVETRSEYETRRAQSVARNSMGQIPSVLGKVLAVPGVLSAYVTENNQNTTQTIGGVSILPNSIYVCVQGGEDADVAHAIWTGKAPGCGYNGSTIVTVYDTSPGYNPPYPAYNVQFTRPNPLPIVFNVVMRNNGQQPANAIQLIQQAIIDTFNGQDTYVPPGKAIGIGDDVLASKFYGNIQAIGSWAQILEITLGSANAQACAFTGSIATNTLTVSAATTNTLAAGQTIKDSGGAILAGTTIMAQLTGTTGGVGTYEVSLVQTVASEAMYSIATSLFEVQSNINQIPTVSANDIAVSFTT